MNVKRFELIIKRKLAPFIAIFRRMHTKELELTGEAEKLAPIRSHSQKLASKKKALLGTGRPLTIACHMKKK
jgi:hypothetical protein